MFICKQCAKNYDFTMPLESMEISKGPCEDCHKIADCYNTPQKSYQQIGDQVNLYLDDHRIIIEKA